MEKTNAELVEWNLARMPEDVLNKDIYNYISPFYVELFIKDHKNLLERYEILKEFFESVFCYTTCGACEINSALLTETMDKLKDIHNKRYAKGLGLIRGKKKEK